jgi:hypothetical protein
MKTYKHINLIYYYDINLQLWTVYNNNDLCASAEYFNNKKELMFEYPDFQFKEYK